MADTLYRHAPLEDFEIRSEAREIAGVVVPFDTPTDVGNYTEVFRRGAFTRTIAERGDRVKLLFGHDTARPLGRAVHLAEEARGLVGTFKVARTVAGDEALELVRSGALDSFSIGFVPITHRWVGDVLERTEVKAMEASLVAMPAYEGALVESVRHAAAYDPTRDPYVLRARLALIL